MMSTFQCKRIAVVGTTSSGKSTLAKQIAGKFDLDFVELDALHWEPHWKGAEPEIFRERVQKAIDSNTWAVAGNYSRVRDLIWAQAEMVIWLDYPFHIVFWRLLTRTTQRIISQEELWNGNRESFWSQVRFLSEDSLFNWLLKTYWRRKKEMPVLFAMPKHKHLKIIHFRHPREVENWLETL